jgi:biotin carboxyl carrier protein
MKLYVDAGGGATIQVDVAEDGEVRLSSTAPSPRSVMVLAVRPGLYAVLVDGRVTEVALEAVEGDAAPGATSVEVRALTREGEIEAQVEDTRTHALRDLRAQRAETQGGSAAAVIAPMPGRIVAVPVAVGDAVERGQPVVVLEAMKMESALAAPAAGRVAEILVSAGQTVQQRQPLVRIEP